jgi:hypothetical protein
LTESADDVREGQVMTEAEGRYRFVSGAAMEPREVLARYPGARFVARAKLAAGAGEDEVWGILIRLAGDDPASSGEEHRPVIADDGRRLSAATENGGQPAGEPAAILAAARYWELPPAYVRRLAEVAGEENAS